MRKFKFAASYLVQWNAQMSTDRAGGQYDKIVYAFCKANHIPIKHTNVYRDRYSYDKLWEQLEHYDNPFSLTLDSHYKGGLSQAFKVFSRPKQFEKLQFKNCFKYETVRELIMALSIKDKSSGLTEYNTTKWGSINRCLQVIPMILTGKKSPAPVLAATRTQKNDKTRLVWAYPAEMTIIEAMIARPLIDYYTQLHVDVPMSFGMYSATTGGRMRRAVNRRKYHTSIDYSQFDSTVSAKAIQYAFNAFRTWFDLDEIVFEDVTVADVFNVVEKYFITCPIVMPQRGSTYPCIVKGKRKGIPSGSYFTQLVGSFVNYANIMTVSDILNLNLTRDDVFVLGDDCLFFTDNRVSKLRLKSILATYGFRTNEKKGSEGAAEDIIEYLGRKWKYGVPIRSYDDINDRALYSEHRRKYNGEIGEKSLAVKGLLHSYGLTSVVEFPPVNWKITEDAGGLLIDPSMASGLTKFYLEEGIIPRNLANALY